MGVHFVMHGDLSHASIHHHAISEA